MSTEVWKDIPGLEGCFQANTFGDVRSLPRNGIISSTIRKYNGRKINGCVLTKRINNKGYYQSTVGGKTRTIHRLIALTFMPNPNNYPQVHHKDHNKLNNRLDNLEWTDNSGNQKAAHAAGRHPRKRLMKNSRKVGMYSLSDDLIDTFECLQDINRKHGYIIGGILKACENHSKTAYGHKWKFLN